MLSKEAIETALDVVKTCEYENKKLTLKTTSDVSQLVRMVQPVLPEEELTDEMLVRRIQQESEQVDVEAGTSYDREADLVAQELSLNISDVIRYVKSEVKSDISEIVENATQVRDKILGEVTHDIKFIYVNTDPIYTRESLHALITPFKNSVVVGALQDDIYNLILSIADSASVESMYTGIESLDRDISKLYTDKANESYVLSRESIKRGLDLLVKNKTNPQDVKPESHIWLTCFLFLNAIINQKTNLNNLEVSAAVNHTLVTIKNTFARLLYLHIVRHEEFREANRIILLNYSSVRDKVYRVYAPGYKKASAKFKEFNEETLVGSIIKEVPLYAEQSKHLDEEGIKRYNEAYQNATARFLSKARVHANAEIDKEIWRTLEAILNKDEDEEYKKEVQARIDEIKPNYPRYVMANDLLGFVIELVCTTLAYGTDAKVVIDAITELGGVNNKATEQQKDQVAAMALLNVWACEQIHISS